MKQKITYNEYLESTLNTDLPNNYNISMYDYIVDSPIFEPYYLEIPNINYISYLLTTLNDFNYLYDILKYKFGNRILKYDLKTFTDLFYGLFYENLTSLNAISELLKKSETIFKNEDSYKDTTETTTDSTANNNESYTGYNVTGDYAKNSSDSTAKGTSKFYNPIVAMNTIYNSNWATAFNNFINQVSELFLRFSKGVW